MNDGNKPVPTQLHCRVSLSKQRLEVMDGETVLASYPVSTALSGAGEMLGSGCTPRGLHRIRLKIGANCPENTVFIGRRPTGEVYSPELAATNPGRDWILTRILWLTGCEPGVNRGGVCDTLRRYIYIHGTADQDSLGKPISHGCIRMKNKDLIDLFNVAYNGMSVLISE